MALTLRLSDQEAKALRDRAEREGRSMQEVARHALRTYLSEANKRAALDLVLDTELERYADALERLGR